VNEPVPFTAHLCFAFMPQMSFHAVDLYTSALITSAKEDMFSSLFLSVC